MIHRRAPADRFTSAALQLGKHKAARIAVFTSGDYGNAWVVVMHWRTGAMAQGNSVTVRPFARRRHGGRPSPERAASQAVRKLAAYGRMKRRMM